MALEPVAGYVLYIGDEAKEFAQSLEEAKRRADNYIATRQGVRIESGAGAMPKQIWNYDYELGAWRGP
jgi:hypothetical protein